MAADKRFIRRRAVPQLGEILRFPGSVDVQQVGFPWASGGLSVLQGVGRVNR